MWGSVLTEANLISNFNYSFSTHKSEILIHLSQWQYWWWFWFSFFWVAYFFLILRLLNKRSMSFNPVLNTSLRTHGKWGDFLVALIPLSWCGNILVNSNFILRMIEWQNEASLFTIRVQGKQWYWVYKFDGNAAQTILSAPKNIGHNRWFVSTPQESYTADSYYQAIQLGTELESIRNYNAETVKSKRELTNVIPFSLLGRSEKFTHTKALTSIFDNNLIYKTTVFKKLQKQINKVDSTKVKDDFNRFKNNLVSENVWHFAEETLKKRGTAQRVPLFIVTKKLTNLSVYNWERNFHDLEVIDDLYNYVGNRGAKISNHAVFFLKGTLNKHNLDLLKNNKFKFEKKLIFNYEEYFKNIQKNSIKKIYSTIIKKLTVKELLHDIYYGRVTPTKIIKECVSNEFFFLKKKNLQNLKLYVSNLKTQIEPLINTKILTKYNLKPIIFNVQFLRSGFLEPKTMSTELYWGFLQERHKRFQKFLLTRGFDYDPKTLSPQKKQEIKTNDDDDLKFDNLSITLKPLKKETNLQIFKNNIFEEFNSDQKNWQYYQRGILRSRHRGELVPVTLARRLLRVKKTLVLPAHVNITLISNSLDVVHSWFIPGLGLKIDCVPGRSTHHTFYIDNVGFYYGQCAEICGRYHHHMPVRLCALSFDHFLVWWQKKGLRRLNRLSLVNPTLNKKDKIEYNWYRNPTSGLQITKAGMNPLAWDKWNE